MKKIILVFIIFIVVLDANDAYKKQIKVLDKCTYLVEPLKIVELELKGVRSRDMEVQKAIKTCEQSLQKHPEDPHIKFLLGRAYSSGRLEVPGLDIPLSVKLAIPELNGVMPQHEKGYYFAQKSCLDGDLAGCTLLGYYAHTGLYKKKYSSKKTFLLWLWACNKGDPKACSNLAEIVKYGKYVPKDIKSDYVYTMKACLSGMYPHACDVYADQYAIGKYQSMSKSEDFDLYINYRACIDGSRSGCFKLKKSLEQNQTKENQKKLEYTLKMSCNNGNANACGDLGELYAKLPKNKINNLMALTFFEEGCNNGAQRFSCWHAGGYRIYPQEGIHQNIDLGISHWEKSCYLGNNGFACYDLANFYLYTKNSKYQNKTLALKPLYSACRNGNAHAFSHGCDLGVEKCCQQLEYKE